VLFLSILFILLDDLTTGTVFDLLIAVFTDPCLSVVMLAACCNVSVAVGR